MCWYNSLVNFQRLYLLWSYTPIINQFHCYPAFGAWRQFTVYWWYLLICNSADGQRDSFGGYHYAHKQYRTAFWGTIKETWENFNGCLIDKTCPFVQTLFHFHVVLCCVYVWSKGCKYEYICDCPVQAFYLRKITLSESKRMTVCGSLCNLLHKCF